MGYYDVYDDNDNLIASEVWIDDGTNGANVRPVVINWRKLLIILLAFVGTISTFVTPIVLYFNKDVFIEGGWLLAALPSVIIGIPIFVIFVLMLITLTKAKNPDSSDEIMEKAKTYINTKIMEKSSVNPDDEEISDEEYINAKKSMFKYQTAVSMVYLAIKFEKYLKVLSLMSYFIYPIFIFCFIVELVYGATESYMIFLYVINFLIVFLGVLSVYKNYKRYKTKYSGNIIKRMICVALGTYLLGLSVGLIIMSAIGMGGYCVLGLCVALFDAVALIDSKLISHHTQKTKNKVHIWAIVVVSIVVGLIATLAICAISIMPGPICDAILAYDEGLSTDLTLPITVWSIGGIITLILIIVISIIVNKRLNKKQ